MTKSKSWVEGWTEYLMGTDSDDGDLPPFVSEFNSKMQSIQKFLKENQARVDAAMRGEGGINLQSLSDTLVHLQEQLDEELDVALASVEDMGLKTEIKAAIGDLFYYIQDGAKKISEHDEVVGKVHSGKEFHALMDKLDAKTRASVYEALCQCLEKIKAAFVSAYEKVAHFVGGFFKKEGDAPSKEEGLDLETGEGPVKDV